MWLEFSREARIDGVWMYTCTYIYIYMCVCFVCCCDLLVCFRAFCWFSGPIESERVPASSLLSLGCEGQDRSEKARWFSRAYA